MANSSNTNSNIDINDLVEAINDLVSELKNEKASGGTGGKRSGGLLFGSGNGRAGMAAKYMKRRGDAFQDRSEYYEKRANNIFNKNSTKLASKALGGLSKGFGKAASVTTKFAGKLAGPFGVALDLAISGLNMLAQATGDYMKYTAKMYKNQEIQEKIQFERSKQEYILRNQMNIEDVSAKGDIQLKMLETQSATMLEALKITSGQYVKAVEVSVGSLTKGINESAYDAAAYSIDAAAEIQKLNLHQTQREQQFGLFKGFREFQKESKLAGMQADIGVTEAKTIADMRKQLIDREIDTSKNYIQKAFRDQSNNMLDSEGYTLGEKTGGTTTDFFDSSKKMTTYDRLEDYGVGGPYKKKYMNGLSALNMASDLGDLTGLGMLGLNLANPLREGIEEQLRAGIDYMNQNLTQTADTVKTKTEQQYKLAETQYDYNVKTQEKILDINTQEAETLIDAAKEVRKTYLNLAHEVEKYTINFEKNSNDLAKNFGYTNEKQLRAFQYSMYEISLAGAEFGRTAEETMKLQAEYINQTGRNKFFNGTDTKKLFALGSILGDDGLAASYASEMEIFNAGVSTSVDMLGEALEDVNRMGLNGRKYTKTIVESLKMAQKYNFRGGTKGMMDMAKWAENVRFNMSSLGGMLEKVMEGGLEGVITQGAQFQVLGGHAAMNADPIAMMFESFADPEAYAKRILDMTKGYGSVNKETGETTFSGSETMMLRQMAKVAGMQPEELMNIVRANNKKQSVVKQLGSEFNETEQSFISNGAVYDRESGEWKVKVKNGNKYEEKAVSDLTKEDINRLMPETHQERIEDYMRTIIDLEQKTKGEEETEKLITSNATLANTIEQIETRVSAAMENFNNNFPKLLEEVNAGQRLATEQYKGFMETAKLGNEAIDNKAAQIQETANNLSLALQETERIIREANAKIAGAAQIEVTKPDIYGNSSQSSNNTSSLWNSVSNETKHLRAGEEAPSSFIKKYTGNSKYGDYIVRIEGKELLTQKGAEQYNYEQKLNSYGNEVSKIAYGIDNGSSSPLAPNKVKIPSWQALDKANKLAQTVSYNNGKQSPWNSVKDGIISNANNSPIVSAASNVTKIGDGLVQSDPKDVAIFAKEGGVIGNFLYTLDKKLDYALGGNKSLSFDTLKVEMDGNLELTSGGQTMNIMEMFRNEPTLLRSLARMLVKELSSSMNGGRGSNSVGISNEWRL